MTGRAIRLVAIDFCALFLIRALLLLGPWISTTTLPIAFANRTRIGCVGQPPTDRLPCYEQPHERGMNG